MYHTSVSNKVLEHSDITRLLLLTVLLSSSLYLQDVITSVLVLNYIIYILPFSDYIM